MRILKRCAVCLLLAAAILAQTILPALAYADVSSTAWYAEAVETVTQKGWMNGSGADVFDPDGTMTRAMFVTVLWRAAGKPAAKKAHVFSDVPAGAYYEAAAAWAAENGVARGMSGGRFCPDEPVTREQVVSMLYRYLTPQSTSLAPLSSFRDASSVSSYALDAIRWAVGAEILKGSGGRLRPADAITRAEAAALLLRALGGDTSSGASGTTPAPATPSPVPTPDPTPTPDPEPDTPDGVAVTVFDPASVSESAETLTGSGERTITLIDQSNAEFADVLKAQSLDAALLSRGVGQVVYQIVKADGDASDLSEIKDRTTLYLPIWKGGEDSVTAFLELGSAAALDTNEYQYNNLTLAPGWNILKLSLSTGSNQGTPIDWTHVVRLRFFTNNANEPADFLLGPLTFYSPETMPGNTTGNRKQDVQCAVDAVNDGIANDLPDGTLHVRVPNGTSQDELERRILEQAELLVSDWLKGVDNIYNVKHTLSYENRNCVIRLSYGSESQTVTLPVEVEYYAKSAARQVTSVYAPDEVIIADIVIGEGEYTIPASESGLPDVTSVIQTALDDCGCEGGGTVWLPKGFYRVTGMLDVPTFVTLRGDWQDPDSVSDKTALEYGTILIADFDADPSKPLINISGACGVMGMTIYYPRQTLSSVQQYRYALNNEGRGIRRADRYMHTYMNCTILNGFDGIGFCTGVLSEQKASTAAEQSLVRNVKGTFLGTAFYNYNASDNGGVTGFTADAGYWCDFYQSRAYSQLIAAGVTPAQPSVTRDEIVAYTKANSTGMMIGDLESDYFSNVHIDGYHNGLLVRQGLRTTFYGDFYHLYVSNCENGAVFDMISGFGVNIACSAFTDNTTDLLSNNQSPVKLVDVTYETTGGTNPASFVVTSDTGLVDPMLDAAGHAGMTTGSSVILDTLDKTATTDVSAQIQSALDRLASTGGVAYLPAGHYRLESALRIPSGVELRGSSPVGVKPGLENDGGTVLEVHFASESYSAAILLTGARAGISGLMLVAADQTPWDGESYIETGYAIRGQDAPGAFVQNSAIVAFTRGIYMERCNGYVVEGMNFTCYENNIAAKDCTGGSIARCLQNAGQMVNNSWGFDGWNFTITTTSPYFTVTSDKLDCVILDSCTGQTLQHWYAYRPHNTLTMKNGSEATMLNTGAGGLAGNDVGSMAVLDASSKLLAINNHQKNRYSVQAENGAEFAVYNRLTLAIASLVPRQGSFRSADENGWLLLDGKESMFGTLAESGIGYDLSGGGTVTCDMSGTPAFGDIIDLSDYRILALDLSVDATTDGGAMLMELGGKSAYFDTDDAGRRTVYLPLDALLADGARESVNLSTLRFTADESVTVCTLHALRALKTLPSGASFTTCSAEGPTSKRVASAENVRFAVPAGGAPLGSAIRKDSGEAQAILSADTPQLDTEYLWKAVDGVKQLQANFPKSVDLSRYHEDGYLHFWLYLPESALNTEFHLELSSAGVNDTDEIEFSFGPGSRYYDMTFQTGWNELWLPLFGAGASASNTAGKPGYMNFAAVNFLRLYQTTIPAGIGQIYVDGFEVVHRANLPDGAIAERTDKPVFKDFTGLTPLGTNSSIETVDLSGERYGRSGTGWLVTSKVAGTSQIIRHDAADPKNWIRAADYAGDGYLHIGLYIPDEESLAKFGSVTIELTSSGTWDVRELQYGFGQNRLKLGWNDLYLPLTESHQSKGATANAAWCDMNAIRTIRVYLGNTAAGVAGVWGDCYLTTNVPSGGSTNIIVPTTR